MISKIPIRTCVGCKSKKAKKDLIRIVRGQEGSLLIDQAYNQPGRGAYLCPDKQCLALTARHRAFDKAFHAAIPAESYEQFQIEFEKCIKIQKSYP
jgi:predicted RNA-binding protein YlxR (DUF448 family)